MGSVVAPSKIIHQCTSVASLDTQLLGDIPLNRIDTFALLFYGCSSLHPDRTITGSHMHPALSATDTGVAGGVLATTSDLGLRRGLWEVTTL